MVSFKEQYGKVSESLFPYSSLCASVQAGTNSSFKCSIFFSIFSADRKMVGFFFIFDVPAPNNFKTFVFASIDGLDSWHTLRCTFPFCHFRFGLFVSIRFVFFWRDQSNCRNLDTRIFAFDVGRTLPNTDLSRDFMELVVDRWVGGSWRGG